MFIDNKCEKNKELSNMFLILSFCYVYISVLLAYVSVCGCKFPGSGITQFRVAIWVLRIELGPLGRIASALTHWPFLQTPFVLVKTFFDVCEQRK